VTPVGMWHAYHTKIEDGGHFIPFDQNICRSKQDMKKMVQKTHGLKSSFKWENKKYIAISL
jgi:hypothetical protein